jgi:hypothetical protein
VVFWEPKIIMLQRSELRIEDGARDYRTPEVVGLTWSVLDSRDRLIASGPAPRLLMRQTKVVLLQGRYTCDAPVENVRIKIRSVWPDYRAQPGVDADTREIRRVA